MTRKDALVHGSRPSAGLVAGDDAATRTNAVIRLEFQDAFAWKATTRFLQGRACARTERMVGERYVRLVRLGDRNGWIAVRPPLDNALHVEVSPSLQPALDELRPRLRRLFDLDAELAIIESHLARHPVLRELLMRTPGLRVPGTFDGFELTLRAILGQQITVKAATTIFGRFVETFGEPLDTPFAGLDRLAPTAGDIASASLQQLIDRGLTRKRAETVGFVARAIAEGSVRFDFSMDAAEVRRRLRAIPGIGPWTAEYVAIRALGDPDGFPSSDLGLMRALKVTKPAELEALSAEWQPFRAYAAIHVWNGLGAGG